VIVETSGIGQGDAEITRLADLCLYVMTAEYGAPSQLEKIEMLDLAHLVAINKFEHKGSKDALRDVRKQVRRNREIPYSVPDEACRCSARWRAGSTTAASTACTRRCARG
jgi:methylmalonyl-CoA mutase